MTSMTTGRAMRMVAGNAFKNAQGAEKAALAEDASKGRVRQALGFMRRHPTPSGIAAATATWMAVPVLPTPLVSDGIADVIIGGGAIAASRGLQKVGAPTAGRVAMVAGVALILGPGIDVPSVPIL